MPSSFKNPTKCVFMPRNNSVITSLVLHSIPNCYEIFPAKIFINYYNKIY